MRTESCKYRKWLWPSGCGRAHLLRTMVCWFLVCFPKATGLFPPDHYEVWRTKARAPGACVVGWHDLWPPLARPGGKEAELGSSKRLMTDLVRVKKTALASSWDFIWGGAQKAFSDSHPGNHAQVHRTPARQSFWVCSCQGRPPCVGLSPVEDVFPPLWSPASLPPLVATRKSW